MGRDGKRFPPQRKENEKDKNVNAALSATQPQELQSKL
jgi:hypothetical protein